MTNDAARFAFESKVASLRGLRVNAVGYWDVHNVANEPVRWDYGDWHHAVMGVQLATDAGPRTITWTNTFHPYGVDVFADPIDRHLVLGDGGPERVGPDGASRWAPFVRTPILTTALRWDRFDLGPAVRASGQVVQPGRTVHIPTALRLDFRAGPVWFVAAMPEPPAAAGAFIPGDEIMVVFEGATMAELGFTDDRFVR